MCELHARGVKMPDVRLATPTGRTLETDAAVFSGLSETVGSDHPIIIQVSAVCGAAIDKQDLRRTMHTYLPGLALGRAQLTGAFPHAVLPSDLPETDEDWQCFECRTRLSQVINAMTERERSSYNLVRVPMATRDDTKTLVAKLEAQYDWPYLSRLDRLPLQDNEESPGLLESNAQILNRMRRGLDSALDTAFSIHETLELESNTQGTDCIDVVMATSSHGRAGAMMKRAQSAEFNDSQEWAKVSAALGQDAGVLVEDSSKKHKHLPNASCERWVTYAKPDSSHTRDETLARAWLLDTATSP